MSQAIALRWLSTQHVQAAQHAAHAAAKAWAHAWGLAEPAQPVASAVAQWPEAGPAGLNMATDEAPPARWAAALTQALFQHELKGSHLAAAVVADATAQLRDALRRALGLASDDMPPGPAAAAHGHAGALVQLELLGCTWWAPVPHAALARSGLIQCPKPTPVPRWNAEQALAAAPVCMQAVLGRVHVDVLEVLNLAHGDVLLLPHQGLDAAVQMQGLGTPLYLQARLGSAQGQRAVQWQASARSIP